MPAKNVKPWHAQKNVRLGAVGIGALAVAVIIAIVLGNGGGSSAPTTTQGTVSPINPIALTASQLATYVGDLNQTVYWVGPVKGDKYELTRTTANSVFVRYLPADVKAGTHQRKYLVVATYPYKGALTALKASGIGTPVAVAGGKKGIAVVEDKLPTNVLVAFPGVDFQIEVFDPSPKKARAWAISGAITPVP